MQRLALITLLVALSIIGSPLARQAERLIVDDPGVPDTLIIDSVRVALSQDAVVPIRFVNDESLAAIEVTVELTATDFVIDSFSFIGSRVEAYDLKGSVALTKVLTAYVFQSEEDAILPGSGLFGFLYCSYGSGATEQVVPVDTSSIIIDNIEHATYFTIERPDTVESFVPAVDPGMINLVASCCLTTRGNIDNDPENTVDVGDLTTLIGFLFLGSPSQLPCPASNNIDASSNGEIDVGDLTYLIGYLFLDPEQNALPPCP